MSYEEMTEQLSRQSAGYILLVVDSKGEIFGSTSEIPLTLSMIAAHSKSAVKPQDLLNSICVMGNLTKGKKNSGKGRKPRAKKSTAQAKPEPNPT